MIAALAVAPVLLWRLYVGWTILPDWGLKGFMDKPPDLGWPFVGFIDLWTAIGSGKYYADPAIARAGTVYPGLLIAAFVLSCALAIRAPSVANFAAAVYALIAVSLNYTMIWVHVGNGQRGTYEVFVALAVSTIDIRQYPPALRVSLSALWCAAAAYVFYGAYSAEFIRGALGLPG
jgi:hypothetical protein